MGDGGGHEPIAAEPSSHLGWALVTTVAFLPLAIPAFVCAGRVRALWSQGDLERAYRASRRARWCGIVALGTGVGLLVIAALAFAVVAYLLNPGEPGLPAPD